MWTGLREESAGLVAELLQECINEPEVHMISSAVVLEFKKAVRA